MRFEFSPSASGVAPVVPLMPDELEQGILTLPELTISPELTADEVIDAFGTGTLGGKLNFLGAEVCFVPGSKLFSGGVSMYLTLTFRMDRLYTVTLSPRKPGGFDDPTEEELERCLAFLAPIFEESSKRYYWGSVRVDEAAGTIVIRYL